MGHDETSMRLRNSRMVGLCALTAIAVTAGGCIPGMGQQGPTLEERLDGVIGESERSIIGRWGTPDDSYEFSDGGRRLTWEYGYWVQSWRETWDCELTLETNADGIVVDWEYSYSNNAANPCHDIMDGQS